VLGHRELVQEGAGHLARGPVHGGTVVADAEPVDGGGLAGRLPRFGHLVLPGIDDGGGGLGGDGARCGGGAGGAWRGGAARCVAQGFHVAGGGDVEVLGRRVDGLAVGHDRRRVGGGELVAAEVNGLHGQHVEAGERLRLAHVL